MGENKPETGESINLSYPCFFANPVIKEGKVVAYTKGESVSLDKGNLFTPQSPIWEPGDIFWEKAAKKDTGPLNVDGKAIFQIVQIQDGKALVRRLTREEAEMVMEKQTDNEEGIVYPWRSPKETAVKAREIVTRKLEGLWKKQALGEDT